MNDNQWGLCPVSRGQIGWRDTDGDSVLDPLDTFPALTLTARPAESGYDSLLTYAGSAHRSRAPHRQSEPDRCPDLPCRYGALQYRWRPLD